MNFSSIILLTILSVAISAFVTAIITTAICTTSQREWQWQKGLHKRQLLALQKTINDYLSQLETCGLTIPRCKSRPGSRSADQRFPDL